MREQHDVLRYKAPKHLRKIGIGAVVVAVLVVAYGITSRASSTRGLQASADEAAIPTVKVIKLSEFADDQTLVLPGNLEAFNNAPIHARVSGYLKNWYVDIGSHVKTGQLMAKIDIPDLDQQLAQAKADLASAIANERLARTTATRWRGLLTQDAVSKQEDDEKSGDEAAKIAAVASAHAAVDRYEALESFKRIVAPFDGVVTTRATDIGTLINVGGPTDTPLFTVSDEKQLRLYVEVPQDYSARIKVGMTATFAVPQHPGDRFKATVTSTAEAINVSSGTLRVQLLTDNSANQLHPGDYSQVQFDLAKGSAVAVPASALMFRDDGMEVATVSANGRVRLKKIAISRDFGPAVEVASGLISSDMIVDNPPDLLRENDRVRIASNQADEQEGK
jgi:multidrug efflux system membrane fusion protein